MLITGFFLYKSSSSKTPKIIRLIYDIWFYFILNIILCVVVKGSYIVALSTFFPTNLGYFWYITCYICILIFSPYLNLLIKNLEQKDHCKLLIISLIILSVIPTISGLAVGNVENGYIYSRFIWLIFLALIFQNIKILIVYLKMIVSSSLSLISFRCLLPLSLSLFLNTSLLHSCQKSRCFICGHQTPS